MFDSMLLGNLRILGTSLLQIVTVYDDALRDELKKFPEKCPLQRAAHLEKLENRMAHVKENGPAPRIQI